MSTVEEILKTMNIEDIKQFVLAANKIISQLLVPGVTVAPNEESVIDYNAKKTPDHKPKGGWISPDELRAKNQQMTEAISLEKWFDGFIFAIQALAMLGII